MLKAVFILLLAGLCVVAGQERKPDPRCIQKKCTSGTACRFVKSCPSGQACKLEAQCLTNYPEDIEKGRCLVGNPVLVYQDGGFRDLTCGLSSLCPKGAYCNTELKDIYSVCCMSDPVQLALEGKTLQATIDTAAEVTIIADRVYKQLAQQPEKGEKVIMSTAGENQTLAAYRVGPLSLELGKVTTKEFMYVASIQDDMLLGMDFMGRYTPAIDFQNRTMSIHNEVIPIRQREVRKPQCRSVSLLKDITLHPNTIINTQCQGKLGEDGLFVIEIEEQLPVLGPRVLIEGNKHPLVCLVNLSDREVKLKKDTQIAKAYPISEVETKGAGGEYLEDRTCQGDAVVDKLPESKSSMFLEACKGLNSEQQNLLEQLLMTHAGVFAEDDLDLGTFTAVKHVIDTVKEGCYHYQGKEILSDLSCGGCKYCTRAHLQWHAFFQEVDDLIPLAGTAMATNQNPHIASVQRQTQWLDVCPKENLQSEQATDQVVAPLYNWLKNGISPTQGDIALSSPAAKFLWINRDMFIIEDGVIYKKEEEKKLVLVPKVLQDKIMHLCHNIPMSGHQGTKRTKEKVGSGFSGMASPTVFEISFSPVMFAIKTRNVLGMRRDQ
ncbi:hypothetical protein RRG08_052330 [Elysia crispata]|uniref:Uncharacterized protein n=1 Tax=Elysia crispata TaxID=231223 RepID=A0AAE0ZBB4_9GAST|nr:hypothetical protein RRG08_052330 [Elysia crispata]